MREADFKRRTETAYQVDPRAVLATFIRLLGYFDRAEEALHEAFRAALEKLPSLKRKRRI